MIVEQKWARGKQTIDFFQTGGSLIVDDKFIVTVADEYTVYTKTQSGREYVTPLVVVPEQTYIPVPSVSVADSVATVVYPENTKLTLQKWATGTQTVEWFNNNGATIIDSTFTVNETGDHTLYYVLENDYPFILSFNVDESQLTPSYRPKTVIKDNVITLTFPSGKRVVSNRYLYGTKQVADFVDGSPLGLGYPTHRERIFVDSNRPSNDITIYYKYDDNFEEAYVYNIQPDELFTEQNVQLSTLVNGETLEFNGKQFMVLDTYNGMIAQAELEEERLFDSSQYVKFNPDRNTNIGYALNVTYYNTLTAAEKDIIINRNYNTSTNPLAYEMVNAKIGLLDVFQGTLDNRLLYPAIKFTPSSSDNTRYRRGMTLTPNDTKDRIQVIEQSGSTNSIDPDTDVAMPLKYMQLDRTAIVKARRNTKSDNMTSTNVNVVNGVVTVNYSGVYVRILEQKWDSGTHDVSYFSANGTSFTKTARFEIAIVGDYTIYTKLENGTEYVKTFTVTEDQLPKPYPKVIWGLDRVLTFTWDDTAELPPTVKYAAGEKDIAYFMGGQIGNAVNQPDATNYPKTYVSASTLYTQVGKMTLYIKDIMGKEYVQIFDVTQEMYDPPVTPVFADNETTQSVEFSGLSSPDMIVWKKWDYGQWEASYFDTNGTQIYDNSFVVTKNGWITLGVRYANFKTYTWKHNNAVLPSYIQNAVMGNAISIEGKQFIAMGDNYVWARTEESAIVFDSVKVPITNKFMNKDRNTNIAYYLNNQYKQSLPQYLQDNIETTTWNVSNDLNNNVTTNMEIGLWTLEMKNRFNVSSLQAALNQYMPTKSTQWWTGSANELNGYADMFSVIYIQSGNLAGDGTQTTSNTTTKVFCPVMRLKDNTKIVFEEA